MERQKSKIIIGIYIVSILMMGAIAISSSLSAIRAHYKYLSQTAINSLISVPCLVVIPITLLSGALMNRVGKRRLLILGIILFIFGGTIPAIIEPYHIVLLCRIIFGIGLALIQTIIPAIIAARFSGDEKNHVQGSSTSMQMIGCITMSLLGGVLGSISWNKVYLVHLIALIPLFAAIFLIPRDPNPQSPKQQNTTPASVHLTYKTIIWCIAMFLFFICGQVYSNSLSFFLATKSFGSTSQNGLCLAFFALGGFLTGLIFEKITSLLKKITLSCGFYTLTIAYLLISQSRKLAIVLIGSFFVGVSITIVLTCIMVETGNSVPSESAGFAVALATCFQNIGQCISPYIVNPISQAIDPQKSNYYSFMLCALFIGCLGIITMLLGIRRNHK